MRFRKALLAALVLLGFACPVLGQPRREEAITRTLLRLVGQIKGFQEHNFSIIVGVDSSASFASSNLTFARLALGQLFHQTLVPGDAVAVFHFGSNVHPMLKGRFQEIPEGLPQARAAIDTLGNQVVTSAMENTEQGTDVNRALLYALKLAAKAPERNCLILLLTDEYREIAQWSKKPANMKNLARAVKASGNADQSIRLGEGVYVRYAGATAAAPPLKPARYGLAPDARSPRQEIVNLLFPRSNEDEPPLPSTRTLWTIGAVVILVLALAGIGGFALTRPLPVTVSREVETTIPLPLNKEFDIGGEAGFQASALPEAIARLKHTFPKRLTIVRLRSNIPCRIVLSGGAHVEQAPLPLPQVADIYWTDPITGRFCSLHVSRGSFRRTARGGAAKPEAPEAPAQEEFLRARPRGWKGDAKSRRMD